MISHGSGRPIRQGALAALLFAVVAWTTSHALATEPEAVGVPVAEGITLAADLYLPGGRPAPTILIRTPYGRQSYEFLGKAFMGRGFVVVVQDVRGKYDSEGEYVPFIHERDDGMATLRWIESQPWCNGRIGIWGQSYSGFAGLAVADADLKSLRSIMSFSGWLDAEDIVRPGGALHLMLNLPWMITQQGRRQTGLGGRDIDELFRHLPLSAALRTAGIASDTWEDPAFLARLAERRDMGEVSRPVLHVTGWSDMVYQASLRAYARLSQNARASQTLIVGPWFHDQMMMGTWEVGDADFGQAAGFGLDELVALSVKWFEATLMKKGAGFARKDPVTYFMMGQDAWQTAKTWPPPSAQLDVQRWYIDSGGRANGASGDGVLATSGPSGAAADAFVFDPMNPVPTMGGANFHFFPDRLGVRDQSDIEKRGDVLVYTSAPLASEIQIVGPLRAHLHVATSGMDTDFTAKLVVVRPDGYARIVEEGIARASSALGTVPPPGTPFALEVEMGQTALSVPGGHRLRLEISSSNFPKYDRNPNTGADPFTATELRPAEQTVFHSERRASFVELPVLRKPVAASAKGMKPLVEPLPPERGEKAHVEGSDPVLLMARGREQLAAGEADAAVASLERATELSPGDAGAYHLLGRAYLAQLQRASMLKKLGLSKKVRESYLRAIELDPDLVAVRISLASFYFNAPAVAGGSESKGMEQVEEVRRHDPREAHLLMAGRYADKKENERAKAEYRAALSLDATDSSAWYRLGLLHQRDQEWDEAMNAFRSGFQADGSLSCLYQVGRTGALSGQNLEQARAALEDYVTRDIDPQRNVPMAGARWRLGMIYEHMGNKDMARREYETALSLDPEMEQAREALENLR